MAYPYDHQQSYGAHVQPDYPPYTSSDFVSPHRDGVGLPGGRNNTNQYPPQLNDYSTDDLESIKGGGGFVPNSVDKNGIPVTRGSIAAQMAAEGQIPKKEGLRMYRKDEHAGALTRGGRARCCGRVVCCTIMLVILILVGIVAAFFLWVKPPDVSFNGIEPPSNGQEVSVVGSGFNINVRLNIGVINPNFFGANFDKISATAYYPTKPNDAIGGGSLDNVDIPKNSNSTIHFPFSLNYTTSYDSDLSVLKDIATKCGFLGGGSKSDLKVNYKVQTKVKVVAISISPTFSSSASFACPLSESDLQGFLGSSDLSSLGLGSLGSVLGGSSRLHRRSPSNSDLNLEANAALSKIFTRGLEVLLNDKRAVVVNAKSRNPKIGTVIVQPVPGEKVFDPTKPGRIGTLGPLIPVPNPKGKHEDEVEGR
ncbi:hypothetical protein JCM5353_005833 [Sporobolomyces roseus]